MSRSTGRNHLPKGEALLTREPTVGKTFPDDLTSILSPTQKVSRHEWRTHFIPSSPMVFSQLTSQEVVDAIRKPRGVPSESFEILHEMQHYQDLVVLPPLYIMVCNSFLSDLYFVEFLRSRSGLNREYRIRKNISRAYFSRRPITNLVSDIEAESNRHTRLVLRKIAYDTIFEARAIFFISDGLYSERAKRQLLRSFFGSKSAIVANTTHYAGLSLFTGFLRNSGIDPQVASTLTLTAGAWTEEIVKTLNLAKLIQNHEYIRLGDEPLTSFCRGFLQRDLELIRDLGREMPVCVRDWQNFFRNLRAELEKAVKRTHGRIVTPGIHLLETWETFFGYYCSAIRKENALSSLATRFMAIPIVTSDGRISSVGLRDELQSAASKRVQHQAHIFHCALFTKLFYDRIKDWMKHGKDLTCPLYDHLSIILGESTALPFLQRFCGENLILEGRADLKVTRDYCSLCRKRVEITNVERAMRCGFWKTFYDLFADFDSVLTR
jgi:hypothetical protein